MQTLAYPSLLLSRAVPVGSGLVFEKGNVGPAGQFCKMSELVCSDRTMFFYMFGFYTAWMLGIAALAYQKLKGFDDYATHFVGRKDYGLSLIHI